MFYFYFDETTSTIKSRPNPTVMGEDASVRFNVKPQPATSLFPQREGIESSASSIGQLDIDFVSYPGTNTSNANVLNERFLARLEEEKEEVIFTMLHSSIEDGYDNEVVEYMRPYMDENKYMTLFWLYGLYAQNMSNPTIFASILYLLCCLDIKQIDMAMMISLVCNGMNSKFSIVQESALKVVEQWRSKECLEALKQATFASKWISSYAERVKKELENELN